MAVSFCPRKDGMSRGDRRGGGSRKIVGKVHEGLEETVGLAMRLEGEDVTEEKHRLRQVKSNRRIGESRESGREGKRKGSRK